MNGTDLTFLQRMTIRPLRLRYEPLCGLSEMEFLTETATESNSLFRTFGRGIPIISREVLNLQVSQQCVHGNDGTHIGSENF